MKTDRLLAFVCGELKKAADHKKAIEMAAYMKTDMPFYGVQKPDRMPILREMKRSFKPASSKEYTEAVLALWNDSHRETKYCAINFAESFPDFVCADSIPLYERLIREGAWWDFVDAISANLVGEAYLKERRKMKALINKWSKDKDMWIRRASLLCHLHHKKDTDQEQLFSVCLKLAPEREFFIQKGMGWALREYSKSDPKAVKDFLKANKEVLSPLTYREAAKHILRQGPIKV